MTAPAPSKQSRSPTTVTCTHTEHCLTIGRARVALKQIFTHEMPSYYPCALRCRAERRCRSGVNAHLASTIKEVALASLGARGLGGE
jgi:hypothetical protein